MIKVGIIGVGNCTAMLVQDVEYYKSKGLHHSEGLIIPKIDKYGVKDIEFVAAFDISKNKVGKTLDKAIFEKPNLVNKFIK